MTWRLMHHIGHCFEWLLITFERPSIFSPCLVSSIRQLIVEIEGESLEYLEPTELKPCINVRMLYIGLTQGTNTIPLLTSAMWKILSALPCALQEGWFKFTPYESLLFSFGFLESHDQSYPQHNVLAMPTYEISNLISTYY